MSFSRHCRLSLPALAAMLFIPSCSSVSSEKEVSGTTGLTSPIAYMPEQLCYLDSVIPSLRVDLMYTGSDNFVGRPIAGYTTGTRPILRRDAAIAFRAAVKEIESHGYLVLLRDAYRPHRALADIAAWAKTPEQSMKQKYYPNIDKSRIHADKYIGLSSEHSLGVAVDITLLDATTGLEIDMGGHVDFLDPSSATRYDGRKISAEAKKNRAFLRSTMRKHGFYNYRKEWWHYWLGKAEAPLIRYDFALNDHLVERRKAAN